MVTIYELWLEDCGGGWLSSKKVVRYARFI
jgi:hypothetical protein